jgi:hypothetical protein
MFEFIALNMIVIIAYEVTTEALIPFVTALF